MLRWPGRVYSARGETIVYDATDSLCDSISLFGGLLAMWLGDPAAILNEWFPQLVSQSVWNARTALTAAGDSERRDG